MKLVTINLSNLVVNGATIKIGFPGIPTKRSNKSTNSGIYRHKARLCNNRFQILPKQCVCDRVNSNTRFTVLIVSQTSDRFMLSKIPKQSRLDQRFCTQNFIQETCSSLSFVIKSSVSHKQDRIVIKRCIIFYETILYRVVLLTVFNMNNNIVYSVWIKNII